MTEKEIRRLTRAELLEMLIRQSHIILCYTVSSIGRKRRYYEKRTYS